MGFEISHGIVRRHFSQSRTKQQKTQIAVVSASPRYLVLTNAGSVQIIHSVSRIGARP